MLFIQGKPYCAKSSAEVCVERGSRLFSLELFDRILAGRHDIVGQLKGRELGLRVGCKTCRFESRPMRKTIPLSQSRCAPGAPFAPGGVQETHLVRHAPPLGAPSSIPGLLPSSLPGKDSPFSALSTWSLLSPQGHQTDLLQRLLSEGCTQGGCVGWDPLPGMSGEQRQTGDTT